MLQRQIRLSLPQMTRAREYDDPPRNDAEVTMQASQRGSLSVREILTDVTVEIKQIKSEQTNCGCNIFGFDIFPLAFTQLLEG